MRASCFECLTDREVEDRAFQRLSGLQLNHVEEHLLFCNLCLDRVEGEEQFAAEVKAGLRHIEEAKASKARATIRRAGVVGFLDLSWNRPLAWMGGTAAVGAAILMAVFLVPRQSGTAEETLVALSVQRSGSVTEATPARAGAPVRLSIDVTELRLVAQYKLEIVDSTGRQVAQAVVSRSGQTLAWPRALKLSPGSYWVRVYDGGGDGELLREFALRSE